MGRSSLAMGLLHRDEPVTDATVNCPDCRAIDWVVRSSRLGGQATIVCRACGHEAGAYLPITFEDEYDELFASSRAALERAAFPVYAAEGLPAEPFSWFGDDEVVSVTLGSLDPWTAVTTEPLEHAAEPPEGLREALVDALTDTAGPRAAGRSTAAWLLASRLADARLEAEVDDLAIEGGVLRVDGRETPCQILRTHRAFAARVQLDEVVVTVASVAVAVGDVSLVRFAAPTP